MSHLLHGQRVWLAALGREDAAAIARWDTDSAFLRLLDAAPAAPRNEDEVARWLENARRAHDCYIFGIRLVGSDELIGWLELDDIQSNGITRHAGWASASAARHTAAEATAARPWRWRWILPSTS
ncbi:MAG: GNAT family N-acetyltransferase [Aggregatilineales bacterium]